MPILMKDGAHPVSCLGRSLKLIEEVEEELSLLNYESALNIVY